MPGWIQKKKHILVSTHFQPPETDIIDIMIVNPYPNPQP
jgi:hypothetical protein